MSKLAINQVRKALPKPVVLTPEEIQQVAAAAAVQVGPITVAQHDRCHRILGLIIRRHLIPVVPVVPGAHGLQL